MIDEAPENVAEDRVDLTAQVRWLDQDEQHAWRGLATVLTLLPLALDRQLREEAGIGHTDYLVLAMLSEAPGRELRMSALAQSTSTSPSRLSHTVRRLEQRGWVTRRPSDQDARGQVAALTDVGLARLVQMAPGHVAEVRRRVLDPLAPGQLQQLSDVLWLLADGLRDHGPVEPL